MGTTSCNNITKERVINELTEAWTDPDRGVSSKPICQAQVGSQFYVVKEIHNGYWTYRVIVLTILEGSGRSWSWKSMCEGMYPYYFDCPPLLLAIAGEPWGNDAARWRNDCIKHQFDGIESGELANASMKEIWGR